MPWLSGIPKGEILRADVNHLDRELTGNRYRPVSRARINQDNLHIPHGLLHDAGQQAADMFFLIVSPDDDRAARLISGHA
jgi:hypothetical protein